MAGIDGINTGAQAWFREPRPGPAQAMLALPKAHGVMSKSPAHSRSCPSGVQAYRLMSGQLCDGA